MSEMEFRVFNGVFGIAAELLYAACLALFLRPFLAKRGRRWRLALTFAFYLLCVPFALHPAVPQGASGLVLTAILTAVSGVLGLERPTAFLLAIFYASLEDYIAKMGEGMSGFELTLRTGNPVTDVIVNDARRRSLDLGIRFQMDFHYPEPEAYDAFDVGIILQNLLQNAVETCGKVSEGERFIALTGKRKGRFFLIEVKNSFAGEVAFGQDGLPVTTKREDVPMHGIGLSNVRWEAEKYMGELELKIDRREFSATVLLQERSNSL